MGTVKPFRFWVGLFQDNREDLVEAARKAEAVGFTGAVQADHYLEMFSPVVALQCIADATTKLRVGTYVIANDYRHPAELVKQFATLDQLSGGRVEIGIGTGYNQSEYDALGLQFDPPKVRVERFEESLEIIRRLLDGEKLTFEGKHYRIKEYENYPKPVQPHLPILVGGGGPKVMRIAGKWADTVGLAVTFAAFGGDVFRSATWEATQQKIDWIREGAGDRFDQVEISSYSSIWPHMVTDDARGEAEKYLDQVRKARGDVSITADELLESPHAFVGTVDHIIEKFQRMRSELGISHFMLYDVDTLAPVVERLAGT